LKWGVRVRNLAPFSVPNLRIGKRTLYPHNICAEARDYWLSDNMFRTPVPLASHHDQVGFQPVFRSLLRSSRQSRSDNPTRARAPSFATTVLSAWDSTSITTLARGSQLGRVASLQRRSECGQFSVPEPVLQARCRSGHPQRHSDRSKHGKSGHRALVKMLSPIPQSGRVEANRRMTQAAYSHRFT